MSAAEMRLLRRYPTRNEAHDGAEGVALARSPRPDPTSARVGSPAPHLRGLRVRWPAGQLRSARQPFFVIADAQALRTSCAGTNHPQTGELNFVNLSSKRRLSMLPFDPGKVGGTGGRNAARNVERVSLLVNGEKSRLRRDGQS